MNKYRHTWEQLSISLYVSTGLDVLGNLVTSCADLLFYQTSLLAFHTKHVDG